MPRIRTSTLTALHNIRHGRVATVSRTYLGAQMLQIYAFLPSTKKLVKNAYNQTMTHHTFLETDGIQPFSPDVKKTVSFHRNKQQATKRTCLECTIFNIFSAVSLQRTVRVVPIVIATIETIAFCRDNSLLFGSL